jgi:hypothetical protein
MGDEPAPVLGVADARAVVRAFRGVAAGQAPQRHPPHHPVHDVLFRVLRHRLVDRHRQILPFAAALAVNQGGDDAGRHLFAGDVVGVPDLRRDRRRVVFELRVGVVAAIHHDAAKRQMNEIGALELGPRAVVAERRHARRNQRRKARVEGGAVEAERRVQPAAAGIEQYVGALQQPQHVLAPLAALQVEHDRFLVAVVIPEEQRAFEAGLIIEKRADAAGGVALGRLDLDDFGAEPGQQQPGIFRPLVGDLDDPQPGQHARPGIAHHFPRPR